MNYNISLLFLFIFSTSLLSQNSEELYFSGDFTYINKKYHQDSISLYSNNNLLTTFHRSSIFAYYLGDELLGEGHCILFKERILHFVLNTSTRKGSFKMGVYKKATDSNNFKLSGNYIDIINNNSSSYYGTPVSLEFMNSSILIAIDINHFFQYIVVPNIESDNIKPLRFSSKFNKNDK
jgi:hypothetical protein